MHLIISAIFLFYTHTAFGTVKDTDQFTSGKDSYKIVAQISDVKGIYAGGVKVAYSVFKNAKFMHPDAVVGGTLIGCHYGTKPPDVVLKRIVVDKKNLGWFVQVLGICGNTTSLKNHLVVPNLSSTSPAADQKYAVTEFISKYQPLVRMGNKKYEIWYTYQEWGNAGTAGSFFVPQVKGVDIGSWRLTSVKTPVNPKDWPKLKHIDYFPSMFVAGMNDNNTDMMQYAVDKLFKTSEAETYRWVGLPDTKKKALALIEVMRDHGDFLLTFLKNK